MNTLADRFIEKFSNLDTFDDESGKPEVQEIWNSLDNIGSATFVRTEVKQYTETHFTNKLSSTKGEQTGFLRGSVYGHVLAKSGDRQFAIRAARFAVDLATRQNKETV